MKNLALFFFFFGTLSEVYASPKGDFANRLSVKGLVKSAINGSLLEKCRVLFVHQNHREEVLTNEKGYYEISLASGWKYEVLIWKDEKVRHQEFLDLSNPEKSFLTRNFYIDYEPIKEAIFVLQGTIFSESETIIGAEIELLNLQTKQISVFKSDKSGNYKIEIPISQASWYEIKVEQSDYFAQSKNIEIQANTILNFELDKVFVGKTFVISQIQFHYNDTSIQENSFLLLDSVSHFLDINPNIEIEIGGHTDMSGSDIYNLQLSANRAKNVANYFVQKGIKPERLKTIGYGESHLLSQSAEENRRIEMKVIRILE